MAPVTGEPLCGRRSGAPSTVALFPACRKRDVSALCFATEDKQEGVDAFIEKLRAEGIEASLDGDVPVRGAYVALRETLGLKS